MKNEADVIIIGAGIWGLSTAYHLAREQTGRSIVVVERNAAVADETFTELLEEHFLGQGKKGVN